MIIEKLALNEIFLAEKDASKTSWCNLEVDGFDHGSIRSSGVMASTGTGSSGWLYGAKRVTANNIKGIASELIESSGADEAMRSEAKRNEAWRGEAKPWDAKRGDARRSEAKQGEAWRGEAK